MPDDDQEINVPAIRRSGLNVARVTSRLLQRGLQEIERHSQAPLNVIDVHAYRDFIFLLSDDWDVQGIQTSNPYDDSYHDLDAVWRRRNLILYRFDLQGVFLDRLVLDLAQFSPTTHSHIKQRHILRLEVRDDYIWFCESFSTDYPSGVTEINYVFSTSGERLVSWSNGELIDEEHPRHLVISDPGFYPSWFLSDIFVELESLSEEGDEHQMYRVKVQELINAVGCADRDRRLASEHPVVYRDAFKAPINNFLYGTSMLGPHSIPPWGLVSTGDESSAWFICSRNQDRDHGDLLWRLHFHDDHSVVTVMNMPDEATLLGNGILQLPSDWPKEAVFESDSEDWARILEKLDRQWDGAHGDDEPEWYISVDREFFRSPRFFASESTVVLIFLLDLYSTSDVGLESTYGRAVAFSVQEDRLIPIKSFNPYSMRWQIKGLRKSHLFGLADTDAGPPEIFIYDLASERITTFQPYVEKFS